LETLGERLPAPQEQEVPARIFVLAACFASLLIPLATSEAQQHPDTLRQATLAELGRQLFFDRRLSGNGKISCGSCHAADQAFSDGRATSIGIDDNVLTRNAPSLLDVADRKRLFWDGRAGSLEEQASMPLVSSLEHGLGGERAVVQAVQSLPAYVEQLQRLFPLQRNAVTQENVTIAIAAFERTLRTADSLFDQHLRDPATALMSASAKRGWEVFKGPARCTQCHTVEGARPTFTDDRFHVSSIAMRGHSAAELPRLVNLVATARGSSSALADLVSSNREVASLGHFVVTFDPKDVGAFRTPGLRNVARTGPYMHDGSVKTLTEAIELELYRQNEPTRRPLALSSLEKDDLLEFLEALSALDTH
jgi:cytochrome c peroxidase